MSSLSNSLETKSNQVHEEVEVDGQVRDEEDGRPPAAVVTLHHHVRIAERDHQIVFCSTSLAYARKWICGLQLCTRWIRSITTVH